MNPFRVGDKVYRNHIFDGTPKQGYPDKSRTFTIVKIEDHTPVDGRVDKNSVCHLKPGISWSFWQNLSPAQGDTQ